MKYIITENRLDDIVDKYITAKFNNLKTEGKKSNSYMIKTVWSTPDNKKIIVTIKSFRDEVFVKNTFFNEIGSMFSIGSDEIQKYLIRWFENHMNIKVDEIQKFYN